MVIALIDLLILAGVGFLAFRFWRSLDARALERRGGAALGGPENAAEPPAARAAELLREFDNVRSELKGRYPAVFAMLGGYLNAHTISDHGGLEGAVREMIADWTPRRDEVIREITRLLAENEAEEDVRAIIAAASDADLTAEGYRPWLIWLLGRFNSV